MSGLQIVYDGECPFCSRYVTMARIRDAVGKVELIDARSDHPLVAEVRAKGFDLNQGMLARYQGRDYFGANCMLLMSLLSSRVGWMNRTFSRIFSHPRIVRFVYPILRLGRNTTLRLMGRSRIPDQPAE